MKRKRMLAIVGLVPAAALALMLSATGAEGRSTALAVLKDGTGQVAGYVHISTTSDNRLLVAAQLTKAGAVAPGFHGFHIHSVGSCVPPFTSAGGHLASEGQVHGEHAGDMPSLLATRDGKGTIIFYTDRAMLDRIFDADGAAVVVHEGPDNFANIPSRYGGPDATTLATGDAGARVLCGELR